MLYHDIPASQGVENALKRAKQMVQLQYTPVKRLPIVEKILPADPSAAASYAETHSPAWLPLQGMIYSSVRRVEKYLGFNISLETFVTAVSNPNSVVYTRPIQGTGQNVHNYYGIVCSCFASYVHDLPYRTPCAAWPESEGITEVDASALENLRLCDIVLNVQKHIAVITGIERDTQGKVHYISVSESVMPVCRVERYTPEEFRGYWLADGYKIYRNANVHRVSYEPSPFVRVEGDPELPQPEINRSLMPDFGNKANYRLGDEPVELSVFDGSYAAVAVTDPTGATELLPVEDGKVVVKPRTAGFYTARCVDGGRKSDAVEWCATALRIEPEKPVYGFGEPVRLRVSNPVSDPLAAWQFNQKNAARIDRGCGGGWLTGMTAGELTLPAPKADGPLVVYLMARNAYGVYTSRYIPIEVRKAQF